MGLQHRFHLPRHARHAGHELALRVECDEPRRGTVGILHRTASARQLGLFAVVIAHRPPDLGEKPLHLPQRRFEEFRVEVQRVADGLFGEIVHRRAQTTRRNHAVGARQGCAQHARDAFAIIADGVHSVHVDARAGKSLRHKRAVGIDELTEQDLRADCNDLDAHRDGVSNPPAEGRTR